MKQSSSVRQHHHFIILGGTWAACMVLSACGGGGGSEPGNAPQSITPVTAVVAAASAPASSPMESASGPTSTSASVTEPAQQPASPSSTTTIGATPTDSTSKSASTSDAISTTAHPLAIPPTAVVAQGTGPGIAAPSTGTTAPPLSVPSGTATSTTASPAISGQSAAVVQAPAGYTIGVYYFPGWTSNLRGSNFATPWDHIKPYPERQPMMGWYSDSNPMVLRYQAETMRAGGIDYVVFDSFWDELGPYMEQALKAYQSVWTEGDPKIALLWASHYTWKGGRANFEKMLDHWISNYLSKPSYQRVDGKPVLYVFSVEDFYNTSRTLGITVAQLGSIVQQRAIAAGLPGIYLVGGAPALAHWARGIAVQAGFSAVSAYNYHIGYSGEASTGTPMPTNYTELSANYQQNWQWIVKQVPLDYITPMSSGWDKTPWLVTAKGQTTYKAIATPDQFETHLRAAKALMDSNPAKTKRMGLVCCWNEFGEGSYIEPTKLKGSQVLDRVKAVFGTQ